MEPISIPLPYKNRVLASLPPADIKRLAPHLSPVTLKANRSLHEYGQAIDTAYFIEDGVCSSVATMENGVTVEVGITGRDGFIGIPAVLGTRHSLSRSFMQIPGYGFSMKAKILRELSEASSGLRGCLMRFFQGILAQTAQTAACNRVHEVEQRLARWLLMCHDRMQSDHLSITHEFLAMMLGANRSTVTLAAGVLREAGLISYSRRHVTVQNREGLARASCECYRIVHEEFLRLGLF
jgi:CRP-like cAMP-binding protein